MMLHHHFILVLLVASMDARCHAFKEVKRISALANPRHRHGLKYVKSARSLISIRGGSGSEDYDKDDEQDDTTFKFIASFESELAEIRRDAEMEAENEMQMLRGLIEQKGATKEDETESESQKNIDGSNENENLETALDSKNGESPDDGLIKEETVGDLPDAATTKVTDQPEIEIDKALHIEKSEVESDVGELPDDGLIKEETVGELPDAGNTKVTDQPEIEIDKALHDDETVEAIEKSVVESDVGDEINEETVPAESNADLQHDKSELPVDPNELSDNSAESDSEVMGAGAAYVIPTDDSTIDNGESAEGELNQKIKRKTSKPKTSEKKRKMSKTGKSKAKKRTILSEESDEGQEVDLGGSVMLTCAQDELTQPRESGILFYLRSDLGRALCLLVATVLLAILTQRMQRQMEAEGII